MQGLNDDGQHANRAGHSGDFAVLSAGERCLYRGRRGRGDRFGQKTGKGISLYADGRTATPDPEIEAMPLAYSEEQGIVRRKIEPQEIVDRCTFAKINEGARIVAEGIAYRPVDVDVVFIAG